MLELLKLLSCDNYLSNLNKNEYFKNRKKFIAGSLIDLDQFNAKCFTSSQLEPLKNVTMLTSSKSFMRLLSYC